MTSAGVFFLVAAVLCAAVVAEEPEARGGLPCARNRMAAAAPVPGRPISTLMLRRIPPRGVCRCTLRLCDLYQCHYRCHRGPHCPALGDLDARKGHGAEINVSKPLKEKVDAFDYVPK
ncbi:hypothetical protein MTO96_031061 [Rhipicephalus appendiculatus]